MMAGEMSPDELDQSLPLRRQPITNQPEQISRSSGLDDDDVQSSAPRTFDRMIKQKLPSYSPLTVSRQKGETPDDKTQEGGRLTLSASMSDNSSSAFNVHSPPYIRRRAQQQSRETDNLDIEEFYEIPDRKSAQNYGRKHSSHD